MYVTNRLCLLNCVNKSVCNILNSQKLKSQYEHYGLGKGYNTAFFCKEIMYLKQSISQVSEQSNCQLVSLSNGALSGMDPRGRFRTGVCSILTLRYLFADLDNL